MAKYRFMLANSLTGDILAELPLQSASYSFALNEPGTFRGTLSLELPDPLGSILANDVFFSADPALDVHALYVERDEVIVWGGLLWADQADYRSEGGTLEVSGEGWHSWLRRQVLTQTLTFTQQDQANIARGLIDWVQFQFGRHGRISTFDIVPTGRLRDRTYHGYERKSIGEAIEELAAVIDGFAWRYESLIEDGRVHTRFLVDYPPSRQTNLVFTLGEQLIGAQVATDRTQLATRVHGIGAGEGDLAVRSSVTDDSLIGARLWIDAVDTHTDVTERETLEDYGAERLQRGSRPIVIPRLTVRADRHPTVDSYRVGDIVGVEGAVGWHQMSGAYRITEISVDVDAEGAEQVALSLAPEGAFTPPGSQVDRPVELASIPSGESWGTPAVEVNEQVIFYDGFDVVHPTNRGLDPAKWFIHDRPNYSTGSYVNNELQIYVPSAVTVENSMLVITARDLPGTGKGTYSSGLVTTAGRVHVGPYGLKVEIRLKAPGSAGATAGLWPSLYMLEENSAAYFGGTQPGFPGGAQGVPGWPTTGFSEVDVWEWPGRSAFEYHVNRHWAATPGGSNPVGGHEVSTSPIDLTDTFNIAGFVWTQTYIAFTFNGREVHRLPNTISPPPSRPMFMILNFAIGGDFGGPVGGNVVFPARYEIDWIKVSPLTSSVKVSTLIDAFDPPKGIWTATGTGGQLSTADGAITITTAPNYPGFRTTSGNYDLTGSRVYAEVSQVPNVGAGSTQAYLTCTFNHTEGQPPQGEIRIGYDGGSLVGQRMRNGTYTTVFEIPYSATAHRYWSMSEAGGTVSYATSADGSTFAVRGTVSAATVGFSLAELDVEVVSGHFAAETTPGVARFAGINVASGVTPPPDDEKPSASNTGLTNPGLLTPAASNTITASGTITNKSFVGYVEIRADNVIFRNCKFTGPSSREALVRVQAGRSGCLFEDCEVDGTGTGTGVGLAYEGYTARRVYIHDCVDGAKLGDNTTLERCYITDLARGPGTHNDGVQSSGGNNITVRGCVIENEHSQTSALFIGADLSNIAGVLVEGCWLSGGGYTMTVGADPGFQLTDCVIRNNKLGKGGFGYFNLNRTQEIDIVGNTDLTTGAAIPDQHYP